MISIFYEIWIGMGGRIKLDLYLGFIHKISITLQPLSGFYIFRILFHEISVTIKCILPTSWKCKSGAQTPHPLLFKALIIYNSFLDIFFRIHGMLVLKSLPCSLIGSRSSFKNI